MNFRKVFVQVISNSSNCHLPLNEVIGLNKMKTCNITVVFSYYQFMKINRAGQSSL